MIDMPNNKIVLALNDCALVSAAFSLHIATAKALV